MDGDRFDRMARSLAAGATRRRVLGTMAAAAGMLLGRARVSAQAGPLGSGLICGGPGGLPCPDGLSCAVPANGCDGSGGCYGTCVDVPSLSPCALIRCAEGYVCCDVCGGACVPEGVNCAAVDCAPTDGGTGGGDGGETCGSAVCGPGEYCCNPSCSRCVPEGQGCTREYCLDEPKPCGGSFCAPGEYCCNDSCGICAPVGAMCINKVC